MFEEVTRIVTRTKMVLADAKEHGGVQAPTDPLRSGSAALSNFVRVS